MIPGFDVISPMLWVMVTAMVVLLVDLFIPADRRHYLAYLSLVGLCGAVYAVFQLWGIEEVGFGGAVTSDIFALLFQLILIVVAAISILLSVKYIETKRINYGEYYALLLFSTSGGMLMAASQELITTFVGLEVLSISLYILAGFARTEARSEESAMKYFLLGAFSSCFFLYGIALIYGGLGTTRIDQIAVDITRQVAHYPASLAYIVAGIAMLIVGLGFKAGVVPFHSWTPDVYEGAPTSVTAFMSAAAKAGAFAAFIRITCAFLPVQAHFNAVLWVLAALTMIVGNVLAVQQRNIKRMLAYSSIAHAGYILVGLLAENPLGRTAVLFYMLAYTFMNLGAFGVLILLARTGKEPVTLDDLKGLGRKNVALGVLMSIFMLSLGGIPPTVGFMGKMYLFLAAIESHLNGLAYLGLLASVVGVFYYLRVIWSMFFEAGDQEVPADVWSFSGAAAGAVAICAVLTIVFGVAPGGLYDTSFLGGNSIVAGNGSQRQTATVITTPISHIYTPKLANSAVVASTSTTADR